MTPRTAPFRRRHLAPRAFTLVELIISIAIALVLMLGINAVFGLASKGIAGGNALSSVTRDNRSAQAVFYNDLRSVVMPPNKQSGTFDDGPAFIIRSERQYAYRNRLDHLGDITGSGVNNPSATDIRSRDIDGDGNETADEGTSNALVDERSHRVDVLMFFARDLFRRQTGGTANTADIDPFVADHTTNEAMVWYGHLRQPDFTTPITTSLQEFQHRDPGDNPYNTNADNFYATNWILGRMVMAMDPGTDTDGDGVGDVVEDRNGEPQNFIQRSEPLTTLDNLQPFTDTASKSGDGWQIQWARYDVVGTSIAQYRRTLQDYHAGGFAPPAAAWWNAISDWRFQANPYLTKPMSPWGIARTSPIFLRGCTQFIVEYAGDFLTQDNVHTSGTYGNVVTAVTPQPDGVIDFVVVNGVKRTRWYGYPRDTNGDRLIPTHATNANVMVDTVPLRDVARVGAGAGFTGFAFERFGPTASSNFNQEADYANPPGAMGVNDAYVCAWGPGSETAPKPRMLRITLALDEPNANMAEAQTYEYVIDLP